MTTAVAATTCLCHINQTAFKLLLYIKRSSLVIKYQTEYDYRLNSPLEKYSTLDISHNTILLHKISVHYMSV